ncbi:MAG TPA: hypothetical protein PLZ45_06790 [Ferruginibacter sp.]|nr:hypothetical protein [Ferruginibacter sp.]
MGNPKIIVCDCDGVLTDGRLNIDHTGTKMFKSFHTKDVRAIREFIANGYEFYIVSCDDYGAKAFAEKVGAVFIELRDKSKVRDYVPGPFICIGDDAWDLPMMDRATIAFRPKDADSSVVHYRPFTVNGGHGVVAELATILL